MNFDFLKIAVRNLTHRRLRSWLTMLGIFIGIAAVVSLIGLGEGLRVAISSQFGAIGSDEITVQAGGMSFGPPGSGVVNPLTLDDAEVLEKIRGADAVVPFYIATGTIEFNGNKEVGFAGGIVDRYRDLLYDIRNIKVEDGRFLESSDYFKAYLGSNFKDDNKFGKAVKVGDKLKINDQTVEVIGFNKKTGSFIEDGRILMNDKPLREIFNEDEKVSLITVKASKGEDLEQLKERVEKEMRKIRDVKEGKEDFDVSIASETLDTLNSSLFAVQLFVYIIAGISIVVGGIGILNTMYTAVLERTKEIGIMKSIGASNHAIFLIFFTESGLLGLVGGLVGIGLGSLIAIGGANAAAAALGSDLIKANISIYLILGALLFSFLIGCLSGTTPAIKASKMVPVDALRYSK